MTGKLEYLIATNEGFLTLNYLNCGTREKESPAPVEFLMKSLLCCPPHNHTRYPFEMP